MIVTFPCFMGLFFLAEKVAGLIYNAPGAPFYLNTERITAFLQKKRRQKRKPVTIIITTLCALLPVNRKRTRLT